MRKHFAETPRIFAARFHPSARSHPSPAPFTMHPQIAIHKLSLLGNEKQSILHSPKDSADSSTGNLFWLNAARQIDWIKQPKIAHGVAAGEQAATWFPDATLNTCYNAIDRHVKAGFGERPCFHFHSAHPAAIAVKERSIT